MCGLGPCQQIPQGASGQAFQPSETSLASPEQRVQASLARNDDLERELLRRIGELRGQGGDGRCLSLAKTALQEAFMWLNRAVVDRKRAWPEDAL